MELEIITEKYGNPFKFYKGAVSRWEWDVNRRKGFVNTLWATGFYKTAEFFRERQIRASGACGRNYAPNQLREVLEGLVERADIQGRIVLEVGAGHVDNKLSFFQSKGFDVSALDYDWTKLHEKAGIPSNAEHQEEIAGDLYLKGMSSVPHLVGEYGGIKFFRGDVRNIAHTDSEIKNQKFDLIYFFGSIFNMSSICRAVGVQTIPPLREHLSENGQVLVVSGDFAGYYSQTPENLAKSRLEHINLMLSKFSDAKKVKLFTTTKDMVMSQQIREGFKPAEVKDTFSRDLLSQDDKLQIEQLPENLRKYLPYLGTVDAFVASY